MIFTSGGTESINMALFGLASEEPGTVLLTAGEHPAAREACRQLERRGWTLVFVDIDREGRIVEEKLDDLPWSEVKLATLILAHNETGVLQDVAPLAARCRRLGIPLHLDAVQAVGKVPVNFRELDATALSLAAHKFHGPRGIGRSCCGRMSLSLPANGADIRKRIAGREPSRSLWRSAWRSALERFNAERETWETKVRNLRDLLERGLLTSCRPAVVNGSRSHRLANTLNIAFPGADRDGLLVALDLAGIACSLGSTCASGSTEPAPVLLAMGCSPEVASSSVRFSLSHENTREEIEEAVSRVAQCVARLRRSAVPAAAGG